MPDYSVNISKFVEIKSKALKEYETELREFPHPCSLKAVDLYAKQWGVKMGFEVTEAFKTIRVRK